MTVHYGQRTRPSGVALQNALNEAGYHGQDINFGYGLRRNALNKPEAIRLAFNKRLALQAMRTSGVPCPAEVRTPVNTYPIVGRPDSHRQGQGFWLVGNKQEARVAMRGRSRTRARRGKAAATHFMEYINIDREFRVHVVNSKSIKVSEKIGGGNYSNGAKFQYPHDFDHKITLRNTAKDAVKALGLDFGAVDIMWSDDKPYVSEVNSAPCLTDENSDTLQRYVNAFKEEYGGHVGMGSDSNERDEDTIDYSGYYCDCGSC